MPICKERYSSDKLISRLCIKGDDFELMTMKRDFKPPEYELSLIDSCDNCPIFPNPNPAIDKDELKNVIKEVLREIGPIDKDNLKKVIKEVLREIASETSK
jgi:hypothetical protein